LAEEKAGRPQSAWRRTVPTYRGSRRTALSAAGGNNLEILGADLASQCLQRGLVDEIRSNTQSGAVTMLRFRVPRASSLL
jgi:hypothetical protein